MVPHQLKLRGDTFTLDNNFFLKIDPGQYLIELVRSHQIPVMQLAEINIATLKHPVDDPRVSEFVDNLDRINALAETSDGFIWRLKDDSSNATAISVFGNPLTIINISVWRDVESLRTFTYNSAQTPFIGKRREWMEIPRVPFLVLWWIADGDNPDPQEGKRRLQHLAEHGPSFTAFTFKQTFEPPE